MNTLPDNLSRALVLGLGRFGGNREAIRFLHRRGLRVRVADRGNGPDLADSVRALDDLRGIDWQLGREDISLLDGVDLLVLNPAVPDSHPLLLAAAERGIARTQEVNLFLDCYPGHVVAVTGTNGKSTTSTLLHAALQKSGLPTLLGGNIGNSLLADAAHWQQDQYAVLELSSFQLERLDLARHRVHGAVFTRVLKDHLDRHGTLASYHAAKARLAAIAEHFVVFNLDDAVAAGYPTQAPLRQPCTHEPPAPDSTGIADGWITARLPGRAPVQLVHQDALQLLGEFQRENVMAAASAALLCGADAGAVGFAMATAKPLPFRLQLVATLSGVQVYDNGVSTEIESTRSALRSLGRSVHWVGGGKSKDGDFATVANGVAPHLCGAHLFGAAAKPLAEQLRGRVACTVHDRLPAALDAARQAARPGSQILFSPAFASFDQYPNFRARALEFHHWLAEQRMLTAGSC